MDYLQNPLKAYLVIGVSFLSFLSTLSCLITFLRHEVLHTLGFRLVIGLTLSNLILSLSQLLTVSFIWSYNTNYYNILCDMQAAIVNFSQLASVFWIATLSWIMYLNIIVIQRNVMRKARNYYIFNFILAASFTAG